MSNSWWKAEDFQINLLALIARDRNFLKTCGGLLSPKDFRPARDETDERFVVAEKALEFWRIYKQPIGIQLRWKIEEHIDENKVDGGQRKRLHKLVNRITTGEKLVAVAAMEDQVLKYLKKKKMRDSIENLVQKYEDGTLSDKEFVAISKSVIEWSGDTKRVVSDILDKDSLESRIKRRTLNRKQKRPLLFIDQFDARTSGPGRGDLGLVLALYKKGKSMCLAYIGDAYAKQTLKVLYFTLEDPVEEIEDRMDAALVNLPTNRLHELPNKLRKRFKKFSQKISGRIRVVDCTTNGISIAEIEQEWERQRDLGFAADVVIVDYDDEITPPNRKVDRRHQFGDIYREFRQFLSRRQVIGWIAAQTQRMPEDTMIVNGSKASEDIGKIRKATVGIGIGQGKTNADARYLNVFIHKRDRANFGFEIISKNSYGLFYDREATSKLIWSKKKSHAD